MEQALETLRQSPTGAALLQKASDTWGVPPAELKSKFRWGSVSRTHAVLTRRLETKSGNEIREREITVFLRREGSREEIVLDMAHELVHAITRPAWDPYDPSLTAGKYILAAIDGEGGEVDAMAAECQVLRELGFSTGSPSKRCARYFSSSDAVPNRKKIQTDFYQVGAFLADLKRTLGEESEALPLLSSATPELYSSTGQAPYPVALLDEYRELMRVACENSRKRIEIISSQPVRAPASSHQPVRDTTESFIRSRCQTH